MKGHVWLILTRAELKGHPLLSRHRCLMPTESWLSQVLSTSFKGFTPTGFYLKPRRHSQRQTAWSSTTSTEDGRWEGDSQVPHSSHRSSGRGESCCRVQTPKRSGPIFSSFKTHGDLWSKAKMGGSNKLQTNWEKGEEITKKYPGAWHKWEMWCWDRRWQDSRISKPPAAQLPIWNGPLGFRGRQKQDNLGFR